MKTFRAQSKDGKLWMGSEYNRARFSDFLKNNSGIRLSITPELPESRKQRKFYHGAVLSLWVFLDGFDYKDSDLIDEYHQEAKKEFNGEMVKSATGKIKKVGRSTRGKLNEGYVDRIIDYLEENYGIDRVKVLDPKKYDYFVNEVYMEGKYDSFIEYLVDLGLLKVINR